MSGDSNYPSGAQTGCRRRRPCQPRQPAPGRRSRAGPPTTTLRTPLWTEWSRSSCGPTDGTPACSGARAPNPRASAQARASVARKREQRMRGRPRSRSAPKHWCSLCARSRGSGGCAAQVHAGGDAAAGGEGAAAGARPSQPPRGHDAAIQRRGGAQGAQARERRRITQNKPTGPKAIQDRSNQIRETHLSACVSIAKLTAEAASALQSALS